MALYMHPTIKQDFENFLEISVANGFLDTTGRCHAFQVLRLRFGQFIVDSPSCWKKALLAHTASNLSHIFREANQSTDHLAHMGAEQAKDLLLVEDSPQSIWQFVPEDGLDVGRFRD